MGNKAKINSNLNEANKTPVEKEVEVLYQRMGDRWYAFSIIDDEVYMGQVSEDAVKNAREEKNEKI